jgi:hypothetical protein
MKSFNSDPPFTVIISMPAMIDLSERLSPKYNDFTTYQGLAQISKKEGGRNDRFRQDPYSWLNVFSITGPPLRQRKEDLSLRGQAFVKRNDEGDTGLPVKVRMHKLGRSSGRRQEDPINQSISL